MWVAACCIAHRGPLVTLNFKHFVDFRHDRLDLVEPPE
jgi:predicted nucleic acid-binding protein